MERSILAPQIGFPVVTSAVAAEYQGQDPERQGGDDAQSHRDKSSGRHLMTEIALRRSRYLDIVRLETKTWPFEREKARTQLM
jgi:hypothetical protein